MMMMLSNHRAVYGVGFRCMIAVIVPIAFLLVFMLLMWAESCSWKTTLLITDAISWSSFINKKYLGSGVMTLSELTHSVRAIGDTQLADYSAPGVNTKHRIAHCPPIAVSLYLLALSVSYFKY